MITMSGTKNISSVLEVTDTMFSNITHKNGSRCDGAALYAETVSNVSIYTSVFTQCSASLGGAVIVWNSKSVTIQDCTFNENIADDSGVALTRLQRIPF